MLRCLPTTTLPLLSLLLVAMASAISAAGPNIGVDVVNVFRAMDEATCEAECSVAGHCCQGSGSACQKPSCAMGCLAAQQLASEAACNATCTAAMGGKPGKAFSRCCPLRPHTTLSQSNNPYY